jgi:hypothetical protein
VLKILLFFVVAAVSGNLFPAQDTFLEMVKSVYIAEPKVEIEGFDRNGIKYSLSYDRVSDTLDETVGESEKRMSGEEIELFLRLFFFQISSDKPESLIKAAVNIKGLLKKEGVDVERSAFSVSDADGSITISIGRSKRFENSDNLQIYRTNALPASLQIGNRKILFSDYHKSQLPLAFPGRIDIFEDGELTGSVFFYREEYRQ